MNINVEIIHNLIRFSYTEEIDNTKSKLFIDTYVE